jgi:hypothetical protein
MRESRMSGFVRGARSNTRPYRDPYFCQARGLRPFQKRLRLYRIAIDRILGLPDRSFHMLKAQDAESLWPRCPERYSEQVA